MSNSQFPSRHAVETVKDLFPVGARVALVEMNDPYTKLCPGDKGTVAFVDDTATVHVDWDNGSRLGALYGVDIIIKL